ncbi:MAG: M3 family oligoendopeptidase [Armatimonadota bacterium]|nr:M3 family oligoendopeptidase [Armatimonadota bacterium]
MTAASIETCDVRWDLSDLFSGTDDPRIDQSIEESAKRADAFAEDYRGKIDSADLTAATLKAAILELEDLVSHMSRPIQYANLMFAADTSDPKLGAFMQRMMEAASDIQIKLLFFELELQSANADLIARLLPDDSLADYRHWIETVRLSSPYRLSEVEEVVLEKTANTGSRAWVRLFEEVTSNHVFKLKNADGTIEDKSTEEVLTLLRDPDRNVRQAAADALSEGLGELERVLVFTYNNLLQDKKIEDEMRGYDYPEQSRHLANELDKETVDLVVEMCVKNFDLVSRFYKIKRHILGLPKLTHIDRYAPLFDTREVVPFDQGKRIVLDAFEKFSPDVAGKAREFFDEDWIDAEPRKGKGGGAFCSYQSPDLHPYVFMSYMNRMDDVMTLAHELGHGVHGSYSRAQTQFNFNGTLPLAELASTFGEMLVFESLVEKADRRDRLALYAEKIEGIFATIFRQATMFRFEKECHEKRRAEGELTPEEFGALWQKHQGAMFGDSVELGNQHSCWWSYIGHFIFAPFYVYAYSFGELLVLSLYEIAKQEGPGFASKYVELLKLGGARSPKELMETVGVDLNSREFWQGGFDVLEKMVSTFEGLWMEEKK